MQTEINRDSLAFLVKKPSECTDSNIAIFFELLSKGGKVSINGLLDRIKSCELLTFCLYEDKTVGISAIKKPLESYVRKVINKTKLSRNVEELKYEIGYSVTIESFRRQGISSELKRRLIAEMGTKEGILFCTTAIESSQNFLIQNGFTNIGQAYDGDNDAAIKYYEKEL